MQQRQYSVVHTMENIKDMTSHAHLREAGADIGRPKHHPLNYNLKYFYSFFGIIFQFYFLFFLTEAAQYECSYRRTAHHATGAH